jgi:predicted nucleic acid-binding protein
MAAVLGASSLVFVDSGAWIALALTRDPLHDRALGTWSRLQSAGVQLRTSVPIVLETFTFLERNTRRDVALAWKDRLSKLSRFKVVECTSRDVKACWEFFKRAELHELSAVDATSFVVMRRERMRHAFTFDHHFAAVGFEIVE